MSWTPATLIASSPAVVFGLLQQLEALGLNVPSVLQQLGINGGSVVKGQTPAAVESREHTE